MLKLPNGGILIEDASELPQFDNINTLYADFETTSLNDKLDALNPWHNCYIAGIAITVDDDPRAYYVPVRHRFGPNVDIEAVRKWWQDILKKTKVWCNHNVKYDAHVSKNDFGAMSDCTLRCTVVHSKLLYSDMIYKGGYALDNLSKQWLYEDISSYEHEIKNALGKSKDYGSVASDIMAKYACQDVLTTRKLDQYIKGKLPEDSNNIAEIETKLTRVLYDMEQCGVCVDPLELQIKELELSVQLLRISDELTRIVGRVINPQSPDDVYDLLINQYGLPILAWTQENEDGQPLGNPSFDKEAMDMYLNYKDSPKEVIEKIIEYRKIAILNNLFVQKYQTLIGKDRKLHPNYNQCVKTGRMACSDPNLQQLDKRAKELIHPPEGYGFLSFDLSQIEFRIIVHYINDEKCIKAYNENPHTDFHSWVAEMAGINRKAAKTMNFMMGYGGGKKRAIRVLSANADVIGELKDYDEIKKRAEKVYENYHMSLPSLKPTAKKAAVVCAERGYIYNLHKRRRYLPLEQSHKAFNSLCQGEAADIQKEITVAVVEALKGTPIQMVANVHDATLFQGPKEVLQDPRVQHSIAWILQNPKVPLRVPLRLSMGYGEKHWAEADDNSQAFECDPNLVDTSFSFLK